MINFPRHPKEHEDSHYDVMRVWMNAVEKHTIINRALVLVTIGMVVGSIMVNVINILSLH